MAMDVLDHHNGVVDQDPDRKDQRKERHPVEGETPGPRCEQRRGERQDHRGTDDHRFAPAQGQAHQQDDGASGEPQLLDQLVRFLGRSFPVVSGDRGLDVVRNDRVAQFCQALARGARHVHRVFPRLFRHRDGHGRLRTSCGLRPRGLRGSLPRREPDIALGLGGAGFDVRHLPQVHRPARVHTHHQITHLLRVAQVLTGFHCQHATTLGRGARHGASRHAHVGGRQGLLQSQQVHAPLAQA